MSKKKINYKWLGAVALFIVGYAAIFVSHITPHFSGGLSPFIESIITYLLPLLVEIVIGGIAYLIYSMVIVHDG